MTTTDGDLLLRAILAQPEEDTPRLVYADWLEENGQGERAEFIRVQVELARLPECEFPSDGKRCDQTPRPYSISCRACEGRRLERELPHSVASSNLCYNHTEWAGVVASLVLPQPASETYQFRRGFIHSIACTAADWLAHADTIYWHPEQTVECGHCVGRRPGSPDAWKMNHPCRVCWGKTRIPRGPCPPTAHPIERVTLTTEPNWGKDGWPRYPDVRLDETEFKFDRWPGITFTLPPEPVLPRIPLSRWLARLRETQPQSVYGYPFEPGVRYLDLEIRVPGAGGVYRDLIGQRFGPLSATDRNGGGWVCEAILENAITDASRREVTTILTARSTTTPLRAIV